MQPLSKLILVCCPLCKQDKHFFSVNVPDGDPHIQSYGDIYGEQKKSVWKVCGECGFVHQNPRPSKEALKEYYLKAQYHKQVESPSLPILEKEYNSAYDPDLNFIKETLPQLIKSNALVLDVGCGYGFALKELEKIGFSVFGVEPDSNRATFARDQLKLKNIKIGVLDQNTEFPVKFDLIFSHHAFEHIADFEAVFSGVKNLLKDGGYFFASVPTYRENKSVMSKLYLNSGHYSSFSHKSFARLLGAHGIKYLAHRYYNGYGLRLTDDLMIIGQKQRLEDIDLKNFDETPKEVQKYLNIANPLRSVFFFPKYGLIFKNVALFRRRFMHRLTYLRNPSRLVHKIKVRSKSFSRENIERKP